MRGMDLKSFMAEHGLSYRAMGELLGRPPQTVHRWATGRRLPRTREDFDAIVRATGGKVTIESFFPSKAAESS